MTKLTEGVVVHLTNWNGIEVLWSYSYPFKTVNGEPAFSYNAQFAWEIAFITKCVVATQANCRAQALKCHGFWWDMASHLDHLVSKTMCERERDFVLYKQMNLYEIVIPY